MSYWNRPFFPAWCSDTLLDDSITYDTMVRIVGSFSGIAQAFKVVADKYGWTHIVLVGDDNTTDLCWFGGKPFGEVFGNNENYTLTWLILGSEPTDKQLDDALQEIRSRTRGMVFCCFFLYQIFSELLTLNEKYKKYNSVYSNFTDLIKNRFLAYDNQPPFQRL